MTSAPPIGFEYRPSRALQAATAALVVLAAGAALGSDLPLSLRLGLIVVILVAAIRRFAGWQREVVRALVWRSDGSCILRLRAGAGGAPVDVPAEMRAAQALGPLITLHLVWAPRGRATLWLLPDNTGSDLRRRLRVRIRALSGSDAAAGT